MWPWRLAVMGACWWWWWCWTRGPPWPCENWDPPAAPCESWDDGGPSGAIEARARLWPWPWAGWLAAAAVVEEDEAAREGRPRGAGASDWRRAVGGRGMDEGTGRPELECWRVRRRSPMVVVVRGGRWDEGCWLMRTREGQGSLGAGRGAAGGGCGCTRRVPGCSRSSLVRASDLGEVDEDEGRVSVAFLPSTSPSSSSRQPSSERASYRLDSAPLPEHAPALAHPRHPRRPALAPTPPTTSMASSAPPAPPNANEHLFNGVTFFITTTVHPDVRAAVSTPFPPPPPPPRPSPPTPLTH